jgi:hypothetical protein
LFASDDGDFLFSSIWMVFSCLSPDRQPGRSQVEMPNLGKIYSCSKSQTAIKAMIPQKPMGDFLSFLSECSVIYSETSISIHFAQI